MGAHDDLLLKRAVEQNMRGGMPQQPQQLDINQLLQVLQGMSNSTGASLTGWADLVSVGVLTQEQVFNLLFKGRPPQDFDGVVASWKQETPQES